MRPFYFHVGAGASGFFQANCIKTAFSPKNGFLAVYIGLRIKKLMTKNIRIEMI
jgi:hypothetical protein